MATTQTTSPVQATASPTVSTSIGRHWQPIYRTVQRGRHHFDLVVVNGTSAR